LVDHLAEALSIDERRRHFFGNDDWPGFTPYVAFGKKACFGSACFSGVQYRGGTPSPSQGRKMGVLVMGPGDAMASALRGKVRNLEIRSDLGGPGSAYYQYWLDVMDGRFVPGVDLSFDWASPEDEAALGKVRSGLGTRSAFLYFFSADDAGNDDAKALQNEIFFDDKVRASGRELQAIKLDVAAHQSLFESLGCEQTPAVVVVGADFSPVAVFDEKLRAGSIAKAFAAAAR